MTVWMAATIAIVPAWAVPVCLACRGKLVERMVAAQLATALTTLLLMLMSFAFDQSSFVDLGLTLALLAAPGGLLMAVFVERWL